MESLVHYSNPSHALSVLGVLNEQRQQGQMCDVVLVVADQRYRAHKSVLAASSEYFQSLFTRIDADSLNVVTLDFCEPDAFEIVLNYIYSSSLFVDKGSLAAIQELGYSLGIPYLTNIVSTRPHTSYSVSRKKFSFSEEDENDAQTRSVIVCRVQNNMAHPPSSYQGKTSERPSSPHFAQEHPQLQSESHPTIASSRKSPEQNETTSMKKPGYPYTTILKQNSTYISSVRPQLTSSVSFSDAETQPIKQQSDQEMREESDRLENLCKNKVPVQGQDGKLSQSTDRCGPLIKSLLRRSLSMDSPVPVFSPTLELKELQTREQSVVKMASNSSGSKTSAHNGDSTRAYPLLLGTKYTNRYDQETQVEGNISVKAEPSSPLADPVDIIRITVGEALPVNLKDLETNYSQCMPSDLSRAGKRKERSENRRYPFKKSKIFKEQPVVINTNESESVPQRVTDILNENTEEAPENTIFKCWNCLKVFRSSAGLHRHVNMYHNPEKPYACDICKKRFHTNFKVWTHCQTQHGVLQNPASSSSSSTLDEKFQKKLIDIVREREIKKALLWKLKRNKQVLQSTSLARKRSRSSFVCPYCGKVFVFQSQYRQHLRTHPAEMDEQDMTSQSGLFQEEGETLQQKSPDGAIYTCRLCNVKLSSLVEQGDHERGCRHATVCPYCGLRFSSPLIKKEHETHCKYKKLTCLECMRTFKSSFSIWRHQVEVHNQNMMNVRNPNILKHHENNGEAALREEPYSEELGGPGSFSENISYSDSSAPAMYDSEDSSSYMPEDLSMGHLGKLVVKEEPLEEAVSERDNMEATKEPGVWPCEKCGNLFSSCKALERHQELLCHIKPFICHVCNKAFRTNFRLWSHYQSHMATASEAGVKELDRLPPPLSPSPPLTPQASERPPLQASVLKPAQMTAVIPEDPPEPSGSSESKSERPGLEPDSHGDLSRSNSVENPGGPQEGDALFYHAPSLSALTFKRQYMCKLCHRTFKTAFSLWSHEQSHSHM